MKKFNALTTISGRVLKVNSNVSKRHFTIKTECATYRTYSMSQNEFDENEMNTGNDWQQFLKSDNYYKVK